MSGNLLLYCRSGWRRLAQVGAGLSIFSPGLQRRALMRWRIAVPLPTKVALNALTACWQLDHCEIGSCHLAGNSPWSRVDAMCASTPAVQTVL